MFLLIYCLFLIFSPIVNAINIRPDMTKMFTTDVHGENSTLLYSGKNLAFVCNCDSCTGEAEIVNEKGEVISGQSESTDYTGSPESWKIDVVPTDTFLQHIYTCKNKNSGEISKTYFEPKYLLCEEGGDLCNNIKCDNQGDQNYFCVIDKKNPPPTSCQMLFDSCDAYGLGMIPVGVACVVDQVKPLCQALAKSDSVRFLLNPSNQACDGKNNVEIEVPSLKKKVSVGFIGQLGKSIDFECSPEECKLDCVEKSPKKMIFQQSSVTKTFALSQTPGSAVTKITCNGNFGDLKQYHLYLYNVRIDAQVKFMELKLKQFKCQFANDEDHVGGGQIKHEIKATFTKAGSSTQEVLNVNGFSTENCGTYVCVGTTTVRNCNPFFEATETGNATKIIKCNGDLGHSTKPDGETATAGVATVHALRSACFMVYSNFLLFPGVLTCFFF